MQLQNSKMLTKHTISLKLYFVYSLRNSKDIFEVSHNILLKQSF